MDHITVFSHFSGDELEIDFVTSKKTAFSFHSLVLKVKRELCRNMETMASLYFGHNIILNSGSKSASSHTDSPEETACPSEL